MQESTVVFVNDAKVRVYKSLKGFWHPVSLEEYKVIRFLKGRYYRAIQGAARWCQFMSKAEHNRPAHLVRNPPKLDPIVDDIDKAIRRLETAKKFKSRLYWHHIPQRKWAHYIDAAYELARSRFATPEEAAEAAVQNKKNYNLQEFLPVWMEVFREVRDMGWPKWISRGSGVPSPKDLEGISIQT